MIKTNKNMLSVQKVLFTFIAAMELTRTSTLSSRNSLFINNLVVATSRSDGNIFLVGKPFITHWMELKPMHLRGGYLQDEHQLDDKFGDRELSELHYNIGKDPAAMASR